MTEAMSPTAAHDDITQPGDLPALRTSTTQAATGSATLQMGTCLNTPRFTQAEYRPALA